MRRESKNEPVEAEDGVFDVDEYEVAEADTDDFDDAEGPGYFEDGDLYVEDEVEVAALPEEAARNEAAQKQPAKREPREPREPLSLQAKALWATLLAQARAVELPGAPDTKLQRIGTVAAIVLVSLLVAAGTYLLGRGSGADVEQARLEGAAAGKEAGAIEGAAQGYAAGFKKGRDTGFRKAYIPAYRLYYKRAYEQAGLDVPTSKQIDVPLP